MAVQQQSDAAEQKPFAHFATTATHAGQDPDQWNIRSVVPPISLSTTFKQSSPGKPVRKGFLVRAELV